MLNDGIAAERQSKLRAVVLESSPFPTDKLSAGRIDEPRGWAARRRRREVYGQEKKGQKDALSITQNEFATRQG